MIVIFGFALFDDLLAGVLDCDGPRNSQSCIISSADILGLTSHFRSSSGTSLIDWENENVLEIKD